MSCVSQKFAKFSRNKWNLHPSQKLSKCTPTQKTSHADSQPKSWWQPEKTLLGECNLFSQVKWRITQLYNSKGWGKAQTVKRGSGLSGRGGGYLTPLHRDRANWFAPNARGKPVCLATGPLGHASHLQPSAEIHHFCISPFKKTCVLVAANCFVTRGTFCTFLSKGISCIGKDVCAKWLLGSC